MIKSILIANRGEIACRIIRTAQRLGARTVAVYSDADRNSPHVRLADESFYLGEGAPLQSYLSIPRLLDAANRGKVDAVHPGCGFLAESVEFARACRRRKLIFIGPPNNALECAGSKTAAREAALRVNAPTLPGFEIGDLKSSSQKSALLKNAKRIGFPLLIKAAAGGGGKGIRLARNLSEFNDAVTSAAREAQSAFGDGRLLAEKFLADARHIEVQILADEKGAMFALGERDCTMQRRRQKLIEESPAPQLADATRRALAETALRLAQNVGITGAATVEFLLARDSRFYFLEINPRLQVEHPATEMIFGIDLIEWQLRIAAGESLPKENWKSFGAAIEARICAEDPRRNFLPCAGKITHLHFPAMTNVRIDSGVAEESIVSAHYDSMLAKVIAYGDTRESARRRLINALSNLEMGGVENNAAFLAELLQAESFRRAAHDIQSAELLAPIIASQLKKRAHQLATFAAIYFASPPMWGWRLNLPCRSALAIEDESHRRFSFDCEIGKEGSILLESIGDSFKSTQPEFADDAFYIECGGSSLRIGFHRHCDGAIELFFQGMRGIFRLAAAEDNDYINRTQNNDDTLAAPMNAAVAAVNVKSGDAVAVGDALLILETMKMEVPMRAPRAGIVAFVNVKPGDIVREGDELAELKKSAMT